MSAIQELSITLADLLNAEGKPTITLDSVGLQVQWNDTSHTLTAIHQETDTIWLQSEFKDSRWHPIISPTLDLQSIQSILSLLNEQIEESFDRRVAAKIKSITRPASSPQIISIHHDGQEVCRNEQGRWIEIGQISNSLPTTIEFYFDGALVYQLADGVVTRNFLTMPKKKISYETYLSEGKAWSPHWTGEEPPGEQHFDWQTVLALPTVDQLKSQQEYLTLLARRVEWHLQDWLENYASELPVSDPDDPKAVKAATITMIQEFLPTARLNASESNYQIAVEIVGQCSSQIEFPPFPVTLLSPQDSIDFADCIRSEVTLRGWLLEAQP